MEETAGINTYQRFEYNPLKRFQNHWNHREKNKKLSSENEIQGITDKRSSAAGQESIRKGERYLSKEQEQIKLQIKVGINKESATGKVVADSATATSTATSGAVTAGGSLVVTAGKKAADKFKDYMQERSMASEQAIRNVESKMTEIKNATKVYYCHAYRSCERARNENQNRFVRRFYPKGVNFDHITRKKAKELETWINDYARSLFDGKTADEMYELFLAERMESQMI